MMLLHPVPDLYVSYCASEGPGQWGLGSQSLYVCLDDLIGYSLETIVQSVGFLSHLPPASCSQILLSTRQR